ncbi:MAG: hypothetical protein K2L05_02360 [Muribaculaceae bacterium]|nr:hypothetical protein [Muribaculaceae bacterium]
MSKSFNSYNFDNDNYTDQIAHVLAAIFPLFTIGEIFNNNPLRIGAGVASAILLILLFASFFFKRKVCPKWLRDTIFDITSEYMFFCLPAIMLICAGAGGWGRLYLGIGLIVLYLATCMLRKKVQSDAMSNIENIQGIKAEVTDNSQLIESLFRDKWKVMNKLCNIYYEKSDSTGALKFIVRDIETELQDFRTPKSIADILTTTDRCLDGAISQLRNECGSFLKEQDIEFIGLIFSGLSVRAVCYIMDFRKLNYYQKKNRLISRIAESDAPHKEEFIERLSKFTK